ncbi:MAG: MBL fold metallo-hydrolase [Proteobacteria bacterium]|jgi:metallo-beta-lactamase family protein|nr:MBL fold metallo-hydrolase [Pseudomonadota bacterium]
MSYQLQLQFFGAAQTVTGSKTLLTYDGKKYLIDCGLFQGPKEIRQKNWEDSPELKNLSAIVLTHAHIDHSGYLPRMSSLGYTGPVYSTVGTYDLCKIMLIDAAYLQEEDARFANQKKYSSNSPALPLYTAKDAEKILQQFHSVPFYEWKQLAPNLSFRFLRAGHILGSAVLQISFMSPAGMKILTFTGDLGNSRSFILRDPDPVIESDFLVCESTYGDRVQPREDIFQQVSQIVSKVIGRGGTLIVPAFSVGRTQELLYIMSRLIRDGKIPSVPIYLDSPMAQTATDIYRKHAEELKSDIQDGYLQAHLTGVVFREIRDSDQSMLLCMSTEPKIVISAAGMLTGGRVLHHLKAKLPDEKSGVLFVGYQGVGTKGLLLKSGWKDIRIHQQKVSVEAEIFSIEQLSAHADADDLLKWVGAMKKRPGLTFINHGEKNASETLGYLFRTELEMKCIIAEENKVYTLE